jgi:hypothetical protein
VADRYQPSARTREVLDHLREEGESWSWRLPGYTSEAQMDRTLKPLRERGLIRPGNTLKAEAVPSGEGWIAVELTAAGRTVAEGLAAGRRTFKL